MKAFGLTDTGRKREKNQDSILLNSELQLYVVADGMGGHMWGEVASGMAVTILNDSLIGGLPKGRDPSPPKDKHIEELLFAAVARANSEILSHSQSLTQLPHLFYKNCKNYQSFFKK
jgi:serine/threonine protein phosphatase PrpC